MDLCSRRIVGWSVSERNDLPLARGALAMAIAQRRTAASLIHYTDRGVLYAASECCRILDQHQIPSEYGTPRRLLRQRPCREFLRLIKGARLEYLQSSTRPAPLPQHRSIVFQSWSSSCLASRRMPVAFSILAKEAFIADGLILVDGQPDIIDGFTIQFCAEQRAIGGLPLLVSASQRPIERMRRKTSIDLPERVLR